MTMRIEWAQRKLAEEIAEQRTRRALYEWEFLEELRDRQALRRRGWLIAGDDANPDRDLTADLCLACGCLRTPELHDPCIANLPAVLYACCGHGWSGHIVSVTGSPFGRLVGPQAARKMRELGGNPPAEAFALDPLDGVAAH